LGYLKLRETFGFTRLKKFILFHIVKIKFAKFAQKIAKKMQKLQIKKIKTFYFNG